MRKLTSILLCALTLFSVSMPVAASAPAAASAILVDADSGRVLFEKNADEKRLIASTTKLMTALVAVERLKDLSRTVTVRPEWLATEGSSIYLRAGEEITLEGLLYGLLLQSGNDAALALACICAGSEPEFAALMNEKARELGMTRSSFANASGLNADLHYSTARDMARLAAACLENETVADICACRTASVGTRTFVNHNRLLSLYEGCIGMKTGYTRRAGRTLVSAARRNGQTLIVVTLDDPDDWKEHMALFDYGFANYPLRELCREGEPVQSVPVSGSLMRFVGVEAAETLCWPMAEGESATVRVECPDVVEAPVRKGQSAGRMVYTLNGEEIASVELRYSGTVNRDLFAGRSLFQRFLSAIFGRTVSIFAPCDGLMFV